jgi:hypothetical protein
MSIPLVWAFSLLPDIDFLILGVRHMGPTHSIIFAIAVFLPWFLIKGKEVTPYFMSYASHTVLGDLVTNRGVWFLWPLSKRIFYLPLPLTYSRLRTFSINLELALFGLFVFFFIISKDYAGGLYSNNTKPLFLVPFTALLLPMLFSFPVSVSPRLMLPHLILLVVVLQPFYPISRARSVFQEIYMKI